MVWKQKWEAFFRHKRSGGVSEDVGHTRYSDRLTDRAWLAGITKESNQTYEILNHQVKGLLKASQHRAGLSIIRFTDHLYPSGSCSHVKQYFQRGTGRLMPLNIFMIVFSEHPCVPFRISDCNRIRVHEHLTIATQGSLPSPGETLE